MVQGYTLKHSNYLVQNSWEGYSLIYATQVCAAHWVEVLRHFGLQTGIDFAHFGLESGTVFEGTTGSMTVFIVSVPNE